MTGISIGKNITFNGAKFSIGAGPQPREHRGAASVSPTSRRCPLRVVRKEFDRVTRYRGILGNVSRRLGLPATRAIDLPAHHRSTAAGVSMTSIVLKQYMTLSTPASWESESGRNRRAY
jgi:hypothetical protein